MAITFPAGEITQTALDRVIGFTLGGYSFEGLFIRLHVNRAQWDGSCIHLMITDGEPVILNVDKRKDVALYDISPDSTNFGATMVNHIPLGGESNFGLTAVLYLR